MAQTKTQLINEYRKLAKRADQRLLSLEKLSKQDFYKGVKNYAYARAMRDIKAWSGESAKRFNTKPPRTMQQIRAKINDIKNFLEAPTSTKGGIKKFYSERAKTMAERYGIQADWQTMAVYYQREINKKFDARFGSRTALRAIGAIEDNVNRIRDNIRKHKRSDIRTGDQVVDEVISKMLNQYSKDLRMMGVL